MLMREQDLLGLESWLAHYTQTPEHDRAAARRIRVLLDGVQGYHRALRKSLYSLYVILQISHRGEFRVSERKLIDFNLESEIKSEVTMRTDETTGEYIVSVPSDQRRIYTDNDDAPWCWPELVSAAETTLAESIDNQILEQIFPPEPEA